MAQLTNGREGKLFLGVHFDFHHKVTKQGIVAREHVNMNSNLGLVWAQVSFQVGKTRIYTQEVLLHAQDVRQFTSLAIQVVESPARMYGLPREARTSSGLERELSLNFTSPELILRIRQSVYLPESLQRNFDFSPSEKNEMAIKQALADTFNQDIDSEFIQAEYKALSEISTGYEVLVAIDSGIARGAQTVRGEGPAMFLEPDAGQILTFLRDLRSEAEMAIILG